ncbi:MAG: hypothetical protein BGN97_12630 [Microbacterium sp. 69-10]|uniref:DUF4432 family protein n=1 Tax=Microbacterium sp. 69-10 TaxID=1895783 RepID=UPI000960EFE4|nr:DUF4432 family protein [Microbacterium sp. 69-10]OJU39008.1 MAG: hypothetical protein BGN97_12630 [Microbacterium sp. 69-10]
MPLSDSPGANAARTVSLTVSERRGWELVTLRSDRLEAEVVPGVGGTILQLRSLVRGGTPLLYETPWGLRARGALQAAGSSSDLAMDAYPGGWQTAFPNGGPASDRHGATWTQHGEAWHAAFDWAPLSDGVRLETRLVRSPFRISRDIVLTDLGPELGSEVRVTEAIVNEGGETIQTAWGQHPAFGAPLLSPRARISSTAAGWQMEAEVGASSDPATVLPPGSHAKRFGYFTDFPGDRGFLRLDSPDAGIAVELDWALDPYRCAWSWMEAGAAEGFPYYSSAYVLGLEPFSGWPAGIDAMTDAGRLVAFAPGQRRVGDVRLRVLPL